MSPVRPNLDLAVIGNCEVSALIDDLGRVVWMCLPRPDGDPAFSALLTSAGGASTDGVFAVDMVDLAGTEQRYQRNTAVVETILHDAHGGSLLIRDFCPRYRARGRMFRPMMLVRTVEPIAGGRSCGFACDRRAISEPRPSVAAPAATTSFFR